MAQEIKQANIFGRLGSGIGQGLAQQIPQEIERSRLSSGLNQFEKDSGDLNPIQQLARLSSIPGITPQMIQSFGELGKQQARGQALLQSKNMENQPKQSPFPTTYTRTPAQSSAAPSITKEEHLAKAQEGYIPPTKQQEFDRAGQLYNENPPKFGNDPQKAIDFVESETLRNEAIAQSHQRQHENLTKIQDNVTKRLKDHSDNLGVTIPPNVYSDIQNKAIQATKSKKDGGQGLTEQQAIKEFGKELDSISRDYKNLDSVGNWGITSNPSKDTLSTLTALQQGFEKRDDTENFADIMVSRNGISNMMGYSIARPVKKVPELNREIKQLASLPKKGFEKGFFDVGESQEIVQSKTIEASEKLLPLLKNPKASPLAIAYELQKKGYDPTTWIDYVKNQREINSEKLGLTELQGRELEKTRNFFRPINDVWLESWSGLE